MLVTGTFLLTIVLVVVSTGCSNPGCAASSPGTTGTTSGISSGKLMPNTCPSPRTAAYSGFLYFLDGSRTQIKAAALNSSGSLVVLQSFAAPPLPTNTAESMTIVKTQFLYIPMGDTTIQAFKLNRSTGSLTTIVGAPYTVPTDKGTATTSVSDPQGRFLFVGSKNTGEVWSYSINSATGALTRVEGSPFTAQFTFVAADNLTVDSSGKFLYIGQADPILGVTAFSINEVSGVLVPVPGSPFHLDVAQLGADPSGAFLVGTAQIRNQSGPAASETKVHSLAIESNGVLTEVAGSPFATTFAPYDFMILANGQFMYSFGVSTSSSELGEIEGFEKSASGAVTMLSGSPYNNLPAVYTCQLGQSGTLAVCIDNLPGARFSVLSLSIVTGAISHIGTDLPVSNARTFAFTE
jgi:hypothetical protein